MKTKIKKWLQEKSFFVKLLEIISFLATVAVIVMAIGVWLFPQNFIFALVRSLTPQIALGALVLLVLHLFRNRLKLFLTTYGALMLLLPTFLTLLFPDNMSKIQKGKARIVFAQFNVLKFNHEHESVIQSIKASGADIVSLQEVDGSWARDIHQNIAKQYPYSFSYPSENCCFGIALYSKIPLKNAKLKWLGGVPNITADIQWQGDKIHVLSAHTHAPINKYKFEQRNIHIAEMSAYLKTIPSAKLVIGDFNSVPWDNFLNHFKQQTQLSDSRHSYSSTFPSFLGKFGIPIDYIFHSSELECTGFTAVSSTSSDHKGIKGSFQWKSNSMAKN
jgi:endonuclease/exonuclease/phosphatase (EEP) superfamily protein YafD